MRIDRRRKLPVTTLLYAFGLDDEEILSTFYALVRCDLFAGLGGRRYDLILANPPYVDAEAVAAFPPEHAAEPKLAHAGGGDGLDVVRRILSEAGKHLTPNGALVVEIGLGRKLLERAFPNLPFLWLDTAESAGEVFALTRSDLDEQGSR